jgi:hypothetical protein
VIGNLGSEWVHYKLVSEPLVSTLSLDGPVERSLDRKCEEKLGLEWPISDVGLFQCVK